MSTGYGNVSWHGSVAQAHRIAYWLTCGDVSLKTGFRQQGVAAKYRRFVLHKCDNRLCCNPNHLFLGSMRANLKDAYDKGRKVQPKGSNHVNSKLSTGVAKKIRADYIGSVRQIDLALKYGVSQRVISLIVRGEAYKDEI